MMLLEFKREDGKPFDVKELAGLKFFYAGKFLLPTLDVNEMYENEEGTVATIAIYGNVRCDPKELQEESRSRGYSLKLLNVYAMKRN